MSSDAFWLRQTKDTPLFPDLLWSRPESRQARGKLLVIGGSLHGFSTVAKAHQVAENYGVGTSRIILPKCLRKTLGNTLENAEFVACTDSGYLSLEALGEILINSTWADCVLISGDLGKNSQTAILLDSFIEKYAGKLTITQDAIDYFLVDPRQIINRPETLLALNPPQLQKLGIALKNETPFIPGMGIMMLANALRDLTIKYPITIITKELEYIVVANQGKVSTTKKENLDDSWSVQIAAAASVFWLQNPKMSFEAISSSLIEN